MCQNQAVALTAPGSQQGNTCALLPVVICLQEVPGAPSAGHAVFGPGIEGVRWRALSYATTRQAGPEWQAGPHGRQFLVRGFGTSHLDGSIAFVMCADEHIALELLDDQNRVMVEFDVEVAPATLPDPSVNTFQSAALALRDLGYDAGDDPGSALSADGMTALLRYVLDTGGLAHRPPRGVTTNAVVASYGLQPQSGFPLDPAVHARLLRDVGR